MPLLSDLDLSLPPLGLGSRLRPHQAWRTPASEDEVESVGQKALRLSGLPYLASVLNKPGRAVRGLLGGKPHEGLAILPFSDTLGITHPEDEVTVAQLNKNLGINDDNSWGSWGAGLATETLLDPLTYASFGTGHALTAAGKTAQKAGLLKGMTRAQRLRGFDLGEQALQGAGHTAEQIEHLKRSGKTIVPGGVAIEPAQPLAGLAKVGLPGTQGAVFGTGPLAQRIAGHLDTAGDFVKYSVPGAKTASALFDNAVNRSLTAEGQRGQRTYGAPARMTANATAKGVDWDIRHHLEDLQRNLGPGHSREAIEQAVGMRASGINPSAALPVHPDLWAASQDAADFVRSTLDRMPGEAADQGIKRTLLRDMYTDYLTRKKISDPGAVRMIKRGQLTPTGHASMTQRKNIYANTPGAQFLWKKWANNPELAGLGRTLAPQDVAQRVFADMAAQAQAQGIDLATQVDPLMARLKLAAGAAVPTHEGFLQSKAAKVAARLGKLKAPANVFDPSIANVLNLRQARQGRALTSAKTLYGTLGDNLRAVQPGDVPLPEALRKLGLSTQEGGPLGLQGAGVEGHKLLARHGAPMTEDYIRGLMDPVTNAASPEEAANALRAARGDLRNTLGKYGLPEGQFNDLAREYAGWGAPEEAIKPLKVVDSMTNAFRNLAYSTWLSSHARNLGSGELQAALHSGPNFMQRISNRVLSGGATAAELHKDLPALVPAGLSDEAARRIVGRLAYQHAGVGHGLANAETDLVRGASQLPTGQWTNNPLGHMAKGALQTTKDLLQAFAHPVQKGFFKPGGALEMEQVGRGTRNFPLLQAGRDIGSQVENRVRLSQFLGELKKGWDPAAAGPEVFKSQFDYGGLTPFERKVMRRAFPFYTYMSRNLPLQLENAIARPGVLNPQLRLGTSNMRGEFIPQHIASGVAIPTGGEDEQGNRQFVSQIGTPIEEAFERFKMRPGDPLGSIKDTAMAFGGGLNPLIKGPLESLFDKQLFSGRNLSDLKPQGMVGSLGSLLDPDMQHRGATQFLSQALANSPATRFATALDKLADPRKSLAQKALNLMTGVRVTDVDMNKARAIETRKALEDVLRANPAISQYTNLYVRPEDQEKLSEEDISRLQVLAALQKNAQAYAKERRLAASP